MAVNACGSGIDAITDPVDNADYASCNQKTTGETCTPTCQSGYTATNAASEIQLSCDGDGVFSSVGNTLVCSETCGVGTSFTFQAAGPCGTVTDGVVSEQDCTDETSATSAVVGGIIESGANKVVDCSEWHDNYHGSFHLSCNDGDITVDAGNTCQLNNPCATEEDDCVDGAICTHTGIGTHTCECPAGVYGDGVDGSTATGCTACPANSQSDAGTAAITGCICDNGYVSGDSSGIATLRMLAGDGSTCEKLACPSNSAAVVSDGVGNAQQCACSNGYAGTIAFESSSVEGTVESGTNAYSDSCTRTCDGSAVAPEHTDGTISNDSTATKVPDQVSDSTLMFTCSAGYTGMLTYTCGQDGSFTTPDTCTGNICIRSSNSDARPRPTIIPLHTLEFRYSYPYIDNVFMRTSLVC